MNFKNKFLSLVGAVSLIFGAVTMNQSHCLAMDVQEDYVPIVLYIGDVEILEGLTSAFRPGWDEFVDVVQFLTACNWCPRLCVGDGDGIGRDFLVYDYTELDKDPDSLKRNLLYEGPSDVILFVIDTYKGDMESKKSILKKWKEILENQHKTRFILAVDFGEILLTEENQESIKGFAEENGMELVLCSSEDNTNIKYLGQRLAVHSREVIEEKENLALVRINNPTFSRRSSCCK